MGALDIIKVVRLGKLAYLPAFNLQKLFEKQHLEKPLGNHVLILVEHEPVYTYGYREVVSAEETDKLIGLGAQVIKSDRGGLTTFHGPGQLVAYPILNLGKLKCLRTLRKYVSNLEQVAVHTCRMLGVAADVGAANVSHTGAWANEKKICAIGVHCKRYITTHGLALNCDVDLDWYHNIVPCGIQDREVTSLSAELGQPTSVNDVIPQFLASFEAIFRCCLEEYDESELKQLIVTVTRPTYETDQKVKLMSSSKVK